MICLTPDQAAAAGALDAADALPPPTPATVATVTGLLAPHATTDPATTDAA